MTKDDIITNKEIELDDILVTEDQYNKLVNKLYLVLYNGTGERADYVYYHRVKPIAKENLFKDAIGLLEILRIKKIVK